MTVDTAASIRSIQVGTPATYGSEGASDPMNRPRETAFFKDPIEGDCFLGETNLEGGRQADLEYHGGPDKAVCIYPIRSSLVTG